MTLSSHLDGHLHTERLYLRPYQGDDAKALFAIANDPQVVRYLPDKSISLAELESLIAWSGDCYRQNRAGAIIKLNLAITRAQQVIGWCGLGPSDLNPDWYELYYALAPAQQGQGYAFEAVQALVTKALSDYDLPVLTSTVVPDNGPSVALLTKLGMHRVGSITQLPAAVDDFFLANDLYQLCRPGVCLTDAPAGLNIV